LNVIRFHAIFFIQPLLFQISSPSEPRPPQKENEKASYEVST
jgi:hypothetical protein